MEVVVRFGSSKKPDILIWELWKLYTESRLWKGWCNWYEKAAMIVCCEIGIEWLIKDSDEREG